MAHEKELRVLHSYPQAAGSKLCHIWCSSSKEDLKANPLSSSYKATPTSTKPHLPIVTLPLGARNMR